MKVSLVVAQGVHAGKVIPIASAQFLIGRDPQCNLRPSSPAISKQHAAVIVRDGKIFLKDFGSTNGSFVNGEQVVEEREVKHEDKLKIGPLEFILRVDASSPKPAAAKPTAAKPSAIKPPLPKPASSPATTSPPAAATQPASPAPAATPTTPKPAAPKPVAAKPSAVKPPAVQAVAAPITPAPAVPAPAPAETVGASVPVETSDTVAEDQSDQLAAMLLMEEAAGASADGTAEQSIPDGTTVLEIPAVPEDPKKAADMLQKVKEQSKNNSQAAGDLLRKYMNRPRTQ